MTEKIEVGMTDYYGNMAIYGICFLLIADKGSLTKIVKKVDLLPTF